MFLRHFLWAHTHNCWLSSTHQFTGCHPRLTLALGFRLLFFIYQHLTSSHLGHVLNSVFVLVALSYPLEIFYHCFLFKQLVLLYFLHLIGWGGIWIVRHIWFLRAFISIISVVDKVRSQRPSMIGAYADFRKIFASWGF